jgi:hypothetical protein
LLGSRHELEANGGRRTGHVNPGHGGAKRRYRGAHHILQFIGSGQHRDEHISCLDHEACVPQPATSGRAYIFLAFRSAISGRDVKSTLHEAVAYGEPHATNTDKADGLAHTAEPSQRPRLVVGAFSLVGCQRVLLALGTQLAD